MAIRLLSAIFAPAQPEKTEGKRTKLRMLLTAGCLGILVSSSVGCTAYSVACKKLRRTECLDKFMIGYRNSALAAKAWHREKHRFRKRGNLKFMKDFEAGFLQGYIDVANGSDGCVPAIAPPKYWGWRYQSDIGQQGVNAWYAGYPLGVKAAEQDGVGNWGTIRPIGLQSAMANSMVFMPQPVEGGEAANPFDDTGAEPYPYENIGPGAGEPADPDAYVPPAEGYPDMIAPEAIEEPAIPDALEAPGAPEAAPLAPAAPVDDSTGSGFNNIPLGSAGDAIDDLIPRQDFGSSDDYSPSATVGDLNEDVDTDLSEVFGNPSQGTEFFGDSSVGTPATPADDLPFTFE